MFKNQNRSENASKILLNLAGNMSILGKCQQARDNVTEALALSRGDINLASAAMIYATCNDSSRAQSMIDAARAAAPQNTFLSSIVAHMVRAEIEKNRGNTNEAIQLLESVRTYDLGEVTGLSNNYSRGDLYLRQKRGQEAAAEFRKIVETRGIEIFSPFHGLAYCGLARAAAITGDTGAARKSYQDFFAFWKDADADLPVLVQAHKEYDQLK